MDFNPLVSIDYGNLLKSQGKLKKLQVQMKDPIFLTYWIFQKFYVGGLCHKNFSIYIFE